MLLYSVHEKVYISYKKSQLTMYIAVYLTIYTIRYVHWISTILFLFSRKRDVIKINMFFLFRKEGSETRSHHRRSHRRSSSVIWVFFLICFFFLQRVRDTDKYTDFLWWSSNKKITKKSKKYTVYSECLFLSFTLLKIKFVNLFHWSLSCFFSVDVR